MQLKQYTEQLASWPSSGRHILANYDQSSIVVYQAYNERIAQAIVRNQCFHHPECLAAGYSMNRMSWIKTNFLWMMFRSGWASKVNQERILAIRITLEGFEEILQLVQEIDRSDNQTDDVEERRKRKEDMVRLQWDPDHTPDGSKCERKAIQLGLRGEIKVRLSNHFIVNIEDITDFVLEQAAKDVNELVIPEERVYEPKADCKQQQNFE